MFRRVNSSPVLFAQPLEIKNRQRLGRFKGSAEKMSNLLGDRSVLALRSSLELFVKGVGKILDVQDRHRIPPKLLHNGGTIGACQGHCWRQETSAYEPPDRGGSHIGPRVDPSQRRTATCGEVEPLRDCVAQPHILLGTIWLALIQTLLLDRLH